MIAATSIKQKSKAKTLKNHLKKDSVKVELKNKATSFPSRPLSEYTAVLANRLKTSEKVTQNGVLKSEKWTKSCYDLLSRTITDDLNLCIIM